MNGHTPEFINLNNPEIVNKKRRRVIVETIAKNAMEFLNGYAESLHENFPRSISKEAIENSFNNTKAVLMKEIQELEKEENAVVQSMSPLGQQLALTPHLNSGRAMKQKELQNKKMLFSAIEEVQAYFSKLSKIEASDIENLRTVLNERINFWIESGRKNEEILEHKPFALPPDSKIIDTHMESEIYKMIVTDQLCNALLMLERN